MTKIGGCAAAPILEMGFEVDPAPPTSTLPAQSYQITRQHAPSGLWSVIQGFGDVVVSNSRFDVPIGFPSSHKLAVETMIIESPTLLRSETAIGGFWYFYLSILEWSDPRINTLSDPFTQPNFPSLIAAFAKSQVYMDGVEVLNETYNLTKTSQSLLPRRVNIVGATPQYADDSTRQLTPSVWGFHGPLFFGSTGVNAGNVIHIDGESLRWKVTVRYAAPSLPSFIVSAIQSRPFC